MLSRDLYGYALSTGPEAASAYVRGVRDLLCLRSGAVEAAAESIAHDPRFALGHAALALLGHELCAPVDVGRRLRDAVLHSVRGTFRERSHVHAVAAHVRGDSRPLVAHLAAYPRDALLLSIAVPTIAFAGVTEVPEEAWSIVERAAPAYGDDWWFTGLLAFIRQEQRRFDEAMELSCRSLDEEPGAGHSAHARAHAHYETGDHAAGLSWMDDWVTGDGAATESLTHFSWHAALHELSLGDLDAVRRRYDAQLLPEAGLGCRALVDSGSLLFRWAITPGAADVPDLRAVAAVTDREMSWSGRQRRSLPCTRPSPCLPSGTGPGWSTSPGGRPATRTRSTVRSWPRSGRRSCRWRPRGTPRQRTRWPGSAATAIGSAAPTHNGRSSRRPGSAPCCARTGTTRHGGCSTPASTGVGHRGTSAGEPSAAQQAEPRVRRE